MTAWKKHSPKTSRLKAHALSPPQLSKKSKSLIGSERKEPSRFALKPLGGSLRSQSGRVWVGFGLWVGYRLQVNRYGEWGG